MRLLHHISCLWCHGVCCPAEDLDLTKEVPSLVLTEGPILGGGAFSRVSEVTEETTGNTYAMKRMRKQAVVQCPEHVYFEQVWQLWVLLALQQPARSREPPWASAAADKKSAFKGSAKLSCAGHTVAPCGGLHAWQG
jgi:hypothetical protein